MSSRLRVRSSTNAPPTRWPFGRQKILHLRSLYFRIDLSIYLLAGMAIFDRTVSKFNIDAAKPYVF